MRITDISRTEIKQVALDRNNYVFGFGDTGKRLVRLLLDEGIRILGIWDNDSLKHGTDFCGIPVIPYEDMVDKERVNIFVGCAYAAQEEERISRLNDAKLFQVEKREGLRQTYEPQSEYFATYVSKTEDQLAFYTDEYSRETAIAMMQMITSYDPDKSVGIVTAEEHYFVKEVVESIGGEYVYVDCGAFTGELPYALKKMNRSFKKCYCFEMEKENCANAANNMRKLGLTESVVIENKGICDKEGELYFEKNGAMSKIVDYRTDNSVKTTSIDLYFSDIHVDFIKMDIEGAELSALKGGTRVIKRDRPILAISVYHSLKDRTDIFDFLRSILTDYSFYLRQHSVWQAETVLYAIPGRRDGIGRNCDET